MRRTSLFVTLAFLAGLAVGFCARSAGIGRHLGREAHASDLAAIEKLHGVDLEATFTKDPSYVPKLWSDDVVNLVFPTPAVGIKAVGEAFAKFWAEYPDFRVLKYTPNIKEVCIADGWAIEVVHSEATFKMSARDDPVSVQTDGIRVLKRQSDGSWKFALVGLK
jgi:ketosteroid isomerase-like protein